MSTYKWSRCLVYQDSGKFWAYVNIGYGSFLLLGIGNILFHHTLCIMVSVELSYLVNYRNMFSNQIYFIRFFDLFGHPNTDHNTNITLQNKAWQHLGICPINGLPNSFFFFFFSQSKKWVIENGGIWSSQSLKAIVRRIAPIMARFGVDVVKHHCDVLRGRCLAEDAWWTKQLNYCLDLCL